MAPKIIGGSNAPSPVGELGMVQMSQALNLVDVSFEQVIIFPKRSWYMQIGARAVTAEINAPDTINS